VRLRTAQLIEVGAAFGSDVQEPGSPPSADNIAVFLVAYTVEGEAVACGALRLLDDGSAEIKRMFVESASRGTGVATTILRALESEARERDVHTLQLETGTALPAAMRFYEREGYVPIEGFGPYRSGSLSRCYSRLL